MWQTVHAANAPLRFRRQRLMRLLGLPVLLLAGMTFVYLYVMSSAIELRQLIESVPVQGVRDGGVVYTMTPTGTTPEREVAVVMMVTATPAPILPTVVPEVAPSGRVSSIRIPAIGVDSRVIEVGWERVINSLGESELVWQVAKYAVGHHVTSAAPGEQDNIVLSAHVGGYGRVFYRLNELQPNDEIQLIREGHTYVYRVLESIYVNEASATETEQIANLSYINPTGSEMVTLVTCWPPSGPDRYSQRLIVRAWPVEETHE